ncbi:MAG TPA: DUF6448 family protein [Candidatus Polarisedimenticolaceae bacterium]|nr:DUF6448 family protein [Candidatus Polarisedimenticolaceae bacterium]
MASAWALVFQVGSAAARAHCDTLSGPVIQDARRALEAGDLAPVLKWVAPADEAAIREAFTRVTTVRKQGDQARELADRYFFETVVRIHRAGEGAPFEGLRSAASIPTLVAAADAALASGSSESLARELTGSVSKELNKRFQAALLLKAHAEDSPHAGRAFVAAYVDYVHFVEGLSGIVEGAGHRQEEGVSPHAH